MLLNPEWRVLDKPFYYEGINSWNRHIFNWASEVLGMWMCHDGITSL